MNECARQTRVLFMERFLYRADNPHVAMIRQDALWHSWLEKDPDPEESMWNLRRGAALRSTDFVARALAVALTPDARMVPFFVPSKAVRFAERPLGEFNDFFKVSGARMSTLLFAAEVLVIGHVSAEQEGLLTEEVSVRYGTLFPTAQRLFSQAGVLSARLHEREQRNLRFHGRLSAA